MGSVIRKIKENISTNPGQTAIVDPGDGGSFTYEQFGDRASRIAAKLVRLGVRPNDFVMIMLPRNKDYIAAMFGAWLAGAGYSPLSPSYPPERIEYIRNDCKAKAVIDERFLRHLEDEQPLCGDIEARPEDPAILIYTSGSTGSPKGVLHSFGSINDAVVRYSERLALPQEYHVGLGAPFTFVVSAQDAFMPLYCGLTAYIVPSETMRDPVLLADFIYENQINCQFISPKMLKVFKPKGDSLKLVHTGSERVSNTYSKDFRLMLFYGQTESAGAVLSFSVDKAYDNTPIGKPIGDIRAYILDENGNEAPEGELCLAGRFADGYLGLPEMTAKTFAPNPFKTRDGYDRLLHTGDIVKMGEDGNILFLNRRDWMVKINGQRVEPGEIETVIKNHKGIHDAVVKDFKNIYGQVYLTAYYVEKRPVDVNELKAELSDRLPPYMIPSFFVRLEKLPVNANGKLDRKALKAPEAGAFKSEYAAPATDMQRAICRAFEKVLRINNVGADDDFFALGGDSIKCAMVSAECGAFKVSISDIFKGKTPRMIERLLLASDEKAPVRKKDRPRVYPLTTYERGMYLEQKLDPDSTVYNLNIAVILKGTDSERVCAALEKVMSAHEALHSFYGEQNGLPVRIVSDKLHAITVKKAASAEEVKSVIDNYCKPFDLNGDIPVRPTVYEVGDGSVILHMAIHHIAFDGGSAAAFANELIDCIQGREPKVSELDLSDLFDRDTSRRNKEGMAYYREMFSDGVPVNEMPTKGKRPKKHPLSDRQTEFFLGGEALAGIDDTARRFGLSEFGLIFAAVSMVLGKYTCSEDVVLGIPTNMRPNGAENVIGMFVNTAPVRVRPVRKMALGEYFKAVSENVNSATYGASLPFEDVVAEFVKQRDESRNPIFDVSVNYLQALPSYKNSDLTAEMYSPLQNMSRDIGIVIRKSESGLQFLVQYSSQLFEDAVIGNFTEQLQYTLKMITDGTARTVGEALALPESQEEQLEKFSTEAEAEVPVKLLHKLFEKTAAEVPDRTALIAKDGTLTYKELNERANIAANSLISNDVSAGDSVVLLLPRDSRYFSCMFGVNKAGAAFIPCDPQYPPERIRTITEDSGARFIITTADKLSDYPADKAIDADELLSGNNTSSPDIPMSGEELSYMIYTSGSTGRPKGVMLKHKGICNYLLPHPANSHMHYLKENISCYLSVTTVSFDMSFKEHTAALCNGKTLIFAAEDEMNDPRALARLMEKHHVDCINATPSRLLQYMEHEPFREALGRCRMVMSGGEGYPMTLCEEIRKCSSDIRIFNTYGPTEITVSCNAADLTEADHITVGRPLLNYKEYIADRFGDILPYGVVGELYVGGIGVAAGYRDLPEKTAQAFVSYRGMRMYRTGDRAKFDSEGKVFILGRADSQVKLRGLRIELGEIEELITAQKGIRKAAVTVRRLNGQENLCAYFTADREIDIGQLREALKKQLTHYMVPTAYMQLGEMPVTANGKTDTKRLPDPVADTSGEYIAPANETERFFCETFAKVLGLERVGANDDFFETGGTSLTVTSIVLAASEKGYDITYGDVFRCTTPHALAELFTQEKVNSADKLSDIEDYDYSKINELLRNNNVESFRAGESRELGNVLITGATGYMGAHLLAQFLMTEKGKAYCMLRKGRFSSARKRLENIMYYYFESSLEEMIRGRVEVFEGDVTGYSSFEQFEDMPIDTVFNCAANVKHFSNGTDIEDINVGGVKNCIRLCRKTGARLIHFSTVSVAGTTADRGKLDKQELDEQTLYFGQELDNKYTSSKFMSERVTLEAAAEGLDAKVIRVGTLAARESDGEFQINFLTNNFIGRLRSYNLLKCFPYSMIENQVCLGPIDLSCKAFLKLSKTPKECCLFNAVNNHTLPLWDIIRRMNESGMNIELVEYDEFAAALNEAQKDPEKAAILSAMTAYMNTAHGKKEISLPCSSHYTTQVLARMGFFWNQSNERYIDDFINALRGFMFFSRDNLKR